MTNSFLTNIDKTWTLFLDRDGVINQRIFNGYVTSVEEFSFITGVLDSIKFFTSTFGRLLIITNQQGVGKGIMTEKDLNRIHDYMLSQIEVNNGKINKIYYCTQLATQKDSCRKPSDVMALMAMKDYPDIDLNKSIMIGDSISDIEFGINSGMKTVFITSSGRDKRAELLADIVANSLEDFKTKLEKQIS